MSALRILHVVPYYEHAWAYGGIPRVATALARGLAGRGHQVTVCTTDACDRPPRARAPPTPHSGSGDARRSVLRNFSNRLAYQWQLFAPVGLSRAVRSLTGRIDVAHLHACRNLPVASAARILSRARIPYVVSPHGTAPLIGRALRSFVGHIDVAHLHACRNLPVAAAARILSRAGIPYVVSPHGTAPRIERRFLAKQIFDATAGRGYLEGAARVLAVSDAERAQLSALGLPTAVSPSCRIRSTCGSSTRRRTVRVSANVTTSATRRSCCCSAS